MHERDKGDESFLAVVENLGQRVCLAQGEGVLRLAGALEKGEAPSAWRNENNNNNTDNNRRKAKHLFPIVESGHRANSGGRKEHLLQELERLGKSGYKEAGQPLPIKGDGGDGREKEGGGGVRWKRENTRIDQRSEIRDARKRKAFVHHFNQPEPQRHHQPYLAVKMLAQNPPSPTFYHRGPTSPGGCRRTIWYLAKKNGAHV
ncbi:hypothetical protein H4582DRAFT_2059267 [Lactarius indigo]|nr:hypothetical protein H4582DRAFT_2059267 [Lactarius indigo]